METQKIILFKPQLDLTKPVVLTFSLTTDNIISGSYTTFNDNSDASEKRTDFIVSGSSQSQLVNIFPKYNSNNFSDLIQYNNKIIKMVDGKEYAKINSVNQNEIDYTINIYSEAPIRYIDFSNKTTIFYYNRKTDVRETNPPHLIAYEGIHEDPKIVSDIFIERGVTSGFDNFKRLKQIKSLQELIKYGDGYFNVTTKATDIITK